MVLKVGQGTVLKKAIIAMNSLCYMLLSKSRISEKKRGAERLVFKTRVV